jgi:hypothetical protein
MTHIRIRGRIDGLDALGELRWDGRRLEGDPDALAIAEVAAARGTIVGDAGLPSGPATLDPRAPVTLIVATMRHAFAGRLDEDGVPPLPPLPAGAIP